MKIRYFIIAIKLEVMFLSYFLRNKPITSVSGQVFEADDKSVADQNSPSVNN